MFKIIMITVISTLMISCSNTKQPIEGYWFGPHNRTIVEFKNDQATFYSLSSKKPKEAVDYIQLDEFTYKLQEEENLKNRSITLNIDPNNKSFSVTEVRGTRKSTKGPWTLAPDLTSSDIIGTWYQHRIEGSEEYSIIIIQKKSSYSFDTLLLDHDKKTYSRTILPEIQVTFTNGFMFTETGSNKDETFYYYITSYRDNIINFVSQYGNQWSQTKVNNPTHITIPQGYTEDDSD